MIRFITGLLLTFGAVGGMEEPSSPLLPLIAIAIAGLALMGFGVLAINRKYE